MIIWRDENINFIDNKDEIFKIDFSFVAKYYFRWNLILNTKALESIVKTISVCPSVIISWDEISSNKGKHSISGRKYSSKISILSKMIILGDNFTFVDQNIILKFGKSSGDNI